MKSFLIAILEKVQKIYTRFGIIAVLGFILALIALLILIFTLKGDSTKPEAINTDKRVKTGLVASLSSNQEPLSLLGRIESTSEADIRAESQGEIVRSYVQTGDRVYAGQILAEFSNSSARAALTQAQGLLESAQAQLLKVQSGSRSEEQGILTLSAEDAAIAFEQAKNSALNEISNAFAVTDDVLFNKVDILFTGPRTYRPELSFVVPEIQIKIDVESGRVSIGRTLSAWEKEIDSFTDESGLQKALEQAQINLRTAQHFIDDVARAVNILRPNAELSEATIATWKANILSARTTLNNTVNSVISEINSLATSKTTLAIAQKNKDIGFSGGRSEDVLVAQANVKQAQGSVAAANAGVEKTIIRTPISGTLNRYTIKRGDFVSLFEPIAVVSNNNALLIKAFITESDRSEITIGADALIDGIYSGTVTNISPALDPVTKKIELTVSIPNNTKTLRNGESVRLEITRTHSLSLERQTLRIPISSLKIEPSRTVVFSVSPENTLIAHPVTLGVIVGEKVEILQGITPDMSIVVDARGLKEGQKIVVQ